MAGKNTFLIHIISCQNTTWQGKVIWTEKKESKSFRSMLELIKLMDAAVNTEEAGKEEAGAEAKICCPEEREPDAGWAAGTEKPWPENNESDNVQKECGR